jgi:Protein of unknown function (DUF2505)
MKFSLSHDFDAPADAIELALLSPELAPGILRELSANKGGPRIESIEKLSEELDGGTFRRLLRYQAAAALPALERVLRGRPIAREMMRWDETFSYERKGRKAVWQVSPMPEYAKWFAAHGTWRLDPLDDGRTRRTVEGELEVRVKLVAGVLERIALAEVKKTYDAEAAALRDLATL